MININEEVEHFKRQLRDQKYCLNKIKHIDDEVNSIEERMMSVTSSAGHIGPRVSGSKVSLEELITKKDCLVKEKNKYQIQIDVVNKLLESIPSDIDRKIIVDMYIEGKYFPALANHYGYSSKSALVDHAKKTMKQLFL